MSTLPDLWWMDPDEAERFRFVHLGHHLPYGDDDESPQWFHSVTPDGDLSTDIKLHDISQVETWRQVCRERNIYRSLKVFSSPDGEDARLGPFLVDIDNSAWDDLNQRYVEDLEDALDVARRVVTVLTSQWGVAERHIRVLFSGRKGFNVEVRPASLRIQGRSMSQLDVCHQKLWALIGELRGLSNIQSICANQVTERGTVIDSIYGSRNQPAELKHRYVRIHGSLNVWRVPGGERARKKNPLHLRELETLTIQDIVVKSEA